MESQTHQINNGTQTDTHLDLTQILTIAFMFKLHISDFLSNLNTAHLTPQGKLFVKWIPALGGKTQDLYLGMNLQKISLAASVPS